MTSINDQWKFQEATINAVRKSMNNGNPQAMIKRMIASERSRPTGQRAQPILNFTIAAQGGQPRDYDQEISEREFAIEKENVAVENDQLNGTQEMAPIAFDFKLTMQTKQTLIKGLNELIKESQYIFSGDIDVIKFVDIFQKFNDLSFSYNEYISDIIRDVEFAHLWHTKLINLETIFVRIKQRLTDISEGKYSGSDNIKISGAYNIGYLQEIITQGAQVIDMMLLNKNTSQYLSIENKPLTHITSGQIESSPQDEIKYKYNPDEENKDIDEYEKQQQEIDRQRIEQEGLQKIEDDRRKTEHERRLEMETRINFQKGILDKLELEATKKQEEGTEEEIKSALDAVYQQKAENERLEKEFNDLEIIKQEKREKEEKEKKESDEKEQIRQRKNKRNCG
jgi:hypothetical protein